MGEENRMMNAPDSLAFYVTPEHPAIRALKTSAEHFLKQWTGTSAADGYCSGDADRVKLMAAAAFGAISEQAITYDETLEDFEETNRRVRLCDAVLGAKIGTCTDMTLLYASLLEAMGLNVLILGVRGHCFAGVWLTDQCFEDAVTIDPLQVDKRVEEGIREILAVECTAMCSGQGILFDEAVMMAEETLHEHENFLFAVDLLSARRSGIRPIQIRASQAQYYEVEEGISGDAARPQALDNAIDFDTLQNAAPVTRQTQWERRLLDFSLRNMLINTRLTKSVVPLLTADMSLLEDALWDGKEFLLTGAPKEWGVSGISVLEDAGKAKQEEFKDLIALEAKHKRIPTVYGEKELQDTLTKLYRSARTSLEENGAGTLYLAVGFLRWFTKDNSDRTARYAPVILLPVEIIRKSAAKGYTLRMKDEDGQINITLLEYLKQNFDLEIGGLNPPPLDDHGLDVKQILAIVRHGIIKQKDWEMVDAAVIGNFSFSQFVMWNDIHSKTDFLTGNKIVRSLMKGSLDYDCTLPQETETEEAYLPVTADGSQLRAIDMAAKGVSFVLHGPPGTGKSQTITAMIANALTKGKTVLFVAEKRAALEVVQKRLAAIGIGEFCLELHSNKATKKFVLEQLKRGLEIGVYGIKTQYEAKTAQMRQMKDELDAYAKALHAKHPFGMSLKELVDLYETLPAGEYQIFEADAEFDPGYAGTLTESDLENQRHVLERLMAAGRAVGHPAEHKLLPVWQTVYSQGLKEEMIPAVQAYEAALVRYEDVMKSFSEQMQLVYEDNSALLLQTERVASGILFADNLPAFLLKDGDVEDIWLEPMAYVQKKEKLDLRKERLLEQWQESFLAQDMSHYRSLYEQANAKILGKSRALKQLKLLLEAMSTKPVEEEKIPALLAEVELYQKEEKELTVLESALSAQWHVVVQKYSGAQALARYKEHVKEQLLALGDFRGNLLGTKKDQEIREIMRMAREVLAAVNQLGEAEEKAAGLLDIRYRKGHDSLAEKRTLCRDIIETGADMKDWIIYRQFCQEAENAGLGPVCRLYENGLVHEDVLNAYLRGIYKALILHIIGTEPALNHFTAVGFEEQIRQFKRLDQECTELTREEMYYILTHNLPTGYESSEISKELNILRRAISGNGRGVTIRSLLEQIPHVLRKLCPCMLMSPISAAQYLSADNEAVDIVIFDEASQLPTCKAVGVLARGKNAVIVGDPNQMPPTSFFAGNSTDEENMELEDLDSILDDCLALGMPQTHLTWHYRSKHESLIAFSNQEFYENSMYTFPTPGDMERKVSSVWVDGYFERGKARVNRAEAEAIVSEILGRYADEKTREQSLGVVTFNVSQQELIENLLAEEYLKDAGFDAWANDREEPLFVKNLENVQGDERDVILFSIAFGPDKEGKMLMNFGPLNKEGGWKRLNVAITRARCEMMVFTIMTPDQIDLRRTGARGVEALKKFLEYAQFGKLEESRGEEERFRKQGIMEALCRELTIAGYAYDIMLGHSGFKIDIAVRDPENPTAYLLGILLDGESYRMTENTKDREVSRVGVLEGLGWKIHRVWTMEWWDNRQKEIRTILELLDGTDKERNY